MTYSAPWKNSRFSQPSRRDGKAFSERWKGAELIRRGRWDSQSSWSSPSSSSSSSYHHQVGLVGPSMRSSLKCLQTRPHSLSKMSKTFMRSQWQKFIYKHTCTWKLYILLFTYRRYISSPCSVFHERLSKRSNVKWEDEGDVCDNSLQEQGILYLVVKATFGTTYAEILFISDVVLDALPKPSGLLRRPVRRSTVPRLWQRRRRWHRLQGLNLKNYILFSLPGVHHRDRHVQLQQRRGETQVKSGRFRFFGGFFGWFAQFWFWCK